MRQQLVLFGGAPVRHQKPEPRPISNKTPASDSAANRVRSSVESQVWRVYEAIQKSGKEGLTDPEIQVVTKLSPNSQRPRRIWLRDLGHVAAKCEDIMKPVLRDGCTVWVCTAKAFVVAAE